MIKYKDYINSDEWKYKSGLFLRKNPTCQICLKYRSENAHHLTYKNLGNEQKGDLMALCTRCHKNIHNSLPYIDDEEILDMSAVIIHHFRKYPEIKTPVLNDVSYTYFNGKSILSLVNETSNDTALFTQNILEVLYDISLEIDDNIIKYLYNSMIGIMKTNNLIENNENIEHKVNQNESDEDFIDRYCIALLNNRDYLRNAMSHMNKEFYNGKMYFVRKGYKSAAQFYKKIKDDKLHIYLFDVLRGDKTIEELKQQENESSVKDNEAQ